MKTLLLLIILFFPFCSPAQEVKKINSEGLQRLIQESDHPLVIGFWATWCEPCLHEIPWLQEAVAKDSTGKTELILLSFDLPTSFPNKITNFIKNKGYKASFYWLEQPVPPSFFPQINTRWEGNIPSSLWINNQTRYKRFYGRQITELQALREVGELISRPKA